MSGHAVLGISCDYHDAAAALVIDGEVVGAAAEERFSRRKHDPDLPVGAIGWLVDEFDLRSHPLRAVVFYAKPFTTAARILAMHGRSGPAAASGLASAVSVWARTKLWIEHRATSLLQDRGVAVERFAYSEHHLSHAASAFFPSPFERAAVLTVDGVGEWTCSAISMGDGDELRILREARFPDSLGLFYTAATTFCGFAANDGEYKLMGLAPYGRPVYEQVLRDQVIDVRPDGSIRLDRRCIHPASTRSMTTRRVARLLGGPPAALGTEPGQREADIARSVQVIVEDALVRSAAEAHRVTGADRLCLAGGVALNCVAASVVRERGPFVDVWVQPAAGDDGGALGAALWYAHAVEGAPRRAAAGTMRGMFLGPDVGDAPAWLTAHGVDFDEADDDEQLCERTAARLAAGDLVGWAQGRMEFGPRALGHRSILADPRDGAVVRTVNGRVKGREGFRPFAPAVVAEESGRWFADGGSPHMSFTARVLSWEDADPVGSSTFADRAASTRSALAACTHVDGSARVQLVDRETDHLFHQLLCSFGRHSGIPVLLNTSLNTRDEPIACSIADVLTTARRAGLDAVVIGRCTVEAAALAAS